MVSVEDTREKLKFTYIFSFPSPVLHVVVVACDPLSVDGLVVGG